MNKTIILLDANVLIDYQYERRFVLERLCDNGWHFVTVKDVMDEVENGESYSDFPIEILRPSIAQRMEARPKTKALSEQDMLCLVISGDNHFSCATNDKRLRNELKRHNIQAYTSKTLLDIAESEDLLTEFEYSECSTYFISVLRYSE